MLYILNFTINNFVRLTDANNYFTVFVPHTVYDKSQLIYLNKTVHQYAQ